MTSTEQTKPGVVNIQKHKLESPHVYKGTFRCECRTCRQREVTSSEVHRVLEIDTACVVFPGHSDTFGFFSGDLVEVILANVPNNVPLQNGPSFGVPWVFVMWSVVALFHV